MKKFWIQVTVLTLVIFGGFYFYSNPSIFYSFFPNATPIVLTGLKLGENNLKIEIADTPEKRARGLSGRESLATDSGMLFTFDTSSKYVFWMKGMKIPLDFIYINDGKVVDLLKNVAPPTPDQPDTDLPHLSPTAEVNMVLEVNSNYIDSHGVKVGDSVTLVK
ncbi:MAG: DUF192 domain-containing protein [Microgenomates group bacterium]|jgi:hypothetical protein